VIYNLRQDQTVQWTPRAAEIRVHGTPLFPELTADYDAEGNLVLTPSYRVKGTTVAGKAFPADAVQQVQSQQGGTWLWDGKGFHPVFTPPKALLPYFDGRKPLRLEGDAIPAFLEQEYPCLAAEEGFWPSKRLRDARVVRETQLAAVAVEAGEGDWLWLDPVYQVGDHRLTIQEIATLQRQGQYARVGDHWVSIRDAAPLLFWRQAGGKLEDGRVRLPRLGYLRARAEWGGGVAVQAPEPVRQFEADLDRIRPPRPGPEYPGYAGELRPYQRAGYDWLWFLRESGLHGVLADEMGLGKTHMAIALLTAAYGNGAAGPSLVVCPTSVLDHWEAKIHAHAPGLKPLRHHGTGRAPLVAATLPPIVLTTYSLLGRDLEQLRAVEWEYVILDEAQKIKNPGTQMAQAARTLRARHRLALTGTPIENRPSELWAIFDFLMPGYLGSAERFRERYEIPITRHGDAGASATLRRVVHPFKLRRLKQEVLAELPPKVEDLRFCQLSAHQAALYREVVAQQGQPLVDTLRRPGSKVDYLHIFAVLSRLKRICDHPSLVLEGPPGRHLSSGKFDLFKELMEEALEGDTKVVVFSQYLEMLDLIEDWLRGKGVGFSGLRGSTQKRGRAVQIFQEDPTCRVFVGSLLAGGLGIDLTAASIVIHYDRWWNAAREDQATDRVHRIGQNRGVHVLKLVTRGTLEEKIDAMIRSKAALLNTIVEKDDAALKSLSRDELIDLLITTP
jgi:superfamily II DNA or RNA helicase